MLRPSSKHATEGFLALPGDSIHPFDWNRSARGFHGDPGSPASRSRTRSTYRRGSGEAIRAVEPGRIGNLADHRAGAVRFKRTSIHS